MKFEPDIHPVCSGCDIPYVLRRALSMSKGWVWTWMSDCRLKSCGKKHAPILKDNDGNVVPHTTPKG